MRSWSCAGGGGLRRGRQNVARGGVAAAADGIFFKTTDSAYSSTSCSTMGCTASTASTASTAVLNPLAQADPAAAAEAPMPNEQHMAAEEVPPTPSEQLAAVKVAVATR